MLQRYFGFSKFQYLKFQITHYCARSAYALLSLRFIAFGIVHSGDAVLPSAAGPYVLRFSF